jgi:hypothetical protein
MPPFVFKDNTLKRKENKKDNNTLQNDEKNRKEIHVKSTYSFTENYE